MINQPTNSDMLDDILADQFCDDTDSDSDFDMLHDFDVDAILAAVDKYDTNNWLLLWGSLPLSSTHCYTLSTLFTFIHTCSSSVLLLLFTASALTFSTVLLMLCSTTVVCIAIPMCLVVLLLTCNCSATCHLVSGLTTTCLATSVLSLFKPTQQFLPAD